MTVVPEKKRPGKKRPWMIAAREIAVVFLMVVVLSQAASALLFFGVPWRLWGDRLKVYRDRTAEACLFSADPAVSYQAVAIGGKAFFQGMDPLFPDDARILKIYLSNSSLEDVLTVVSGLNRLDYDRLLIENRPYFWTNFAGNKIEDQQKMPLWERYGHWDFRLVNPGDAALVFDTMRLWAAGLGQPPVWPSEQKPWTLLNVRFDFDHVRKKNFLDKSPWRHPPADGIYWINDSDFSARDMDPSIMTGFGIKCASGRFDPSIGHFVDHDDLPGVMARFQD